MEKLTPEQITEQKEVDAFYKNMPDNIDNTLKKAFKSTLIGIVAAGIAVAGATLVGCHTPALNALIRRGKGRDSR